MPKLAAQAVLFDVDGTLLQTATAYYEIMCAACREMGLQPPGPEIMSEVMVYERPVVNFIFPPDWPDREAAIRQFRAATQQTYRRLFRELVRPVPGVPEALAELHARGFRLGIVTNADYRITRGLAYFGLDHWFETAVTRAHMPLKKPHAAPLLLCAAQMRLHPQGIVYVGDTPQDVIASRVAGMAAVAVRSGITPLDLLTATTPDLILPSAAELPQHVEVSPMAAPGPAAVISGVVRSGLGEAGGFVSLPWVKEQVRAACGFTPYPGTLNLEIVYPEPPAARAALQRCASVPLVSPTPDFCASDCFTGYLVGGHGQPLPAAVILPHVPDYPPEKLELVTPVHVKNTLGLADGDQVTVVLALPGATPAEVQALAAAFVAGASGR